MKLSTVALLVAGSLAFSMLAFAGNANTIPACGTMERAAQIAIDFDEMPLIQSSVTSVPDSNGKGVPGSMLITANTESETYTVYFFPESKPGTVCVVLYGVGLMPAKVQK